MKKTMLGLIIAGLVMGTSMPGYTSDWDKAGKALTIIEGLRLLTGGKVDFIGTLSGLNKPRSETRYIEPYQCYRPSRKKVWVPHSVWKKKYIPEHEEYSQEYGTIIVEGHYIQYQVERGGHWEWQDCSRKKSSKYRRCDD